MRKWELNQEVDWTEKALEILRERYPNLMAFPYDEVEGLSYYLFMKNKIYTFVPDEPCNHLDTWSHEYAHGPCKNIYDVRVN